MTWKSSTTSYNTYGKSISSNKCTSILRQDSLGAFPGLCCYHCKRQSPVKLFRLLAEETLNAQWPVVWPLTQRTKELVFYGAKNTCPEKIKAEAVYSRMSPGSVTTVILVEFLFGEILELSTILLA
ncbi:hypothetical protein TNCV_3402591 [Trichonephila clavipes]|nr:hypothetical protein TNCV_3402591 [Trichonephila clavipes]